LVRVAFRYGIDPLDITYIFWDDWRPWTIDLDRSLSDERLARIDQTGIVDLEELKSSFILPVAKKISTPIRQSSWPWILALGSRNRKRFGGIQYCSQCLKGDEISYFRLKWRFAWHVCCEKHQLILNDRCPKCLSAVEYHRNDVFHQPMNLCGHCRYDLCDVDQRVASEQMIMHQKICDQTINEGFGKIVDQKLPTDQWFHVLSFFVRLSLKATDQRLKSIRKFVRGFGVELDRIDQSPTGLPMELKSTHQRYQLLGQATKLMDTNLIDLKERLEELHMGLRTLLSFMNPLPKVINDMFVSEDFDFHKSERICRNYLPVNQLNVSKKFNRLVRMIRKDG
jgi:hypothetical protein